VLGAASLEHEVVRAIGVNVLLFADYVCVGNVAMFISETGREPVTASMLRLRLLFRGLCFDAQMSPFSCRGVAGLQYRQIPNTLFAREFQFTESTPRCFGYDAIDSKFDV
jgi:hypothetical protein